MEDKGGTGREHSSGGYPDVKKHMYQLRWWQTKWGKKPTDLRIGVKVEKVYHNWVCMYGFALG